MDLNQQLNLISPQNTDWERDVRRWTSTSNSILSEQRLGKGRQKVDLNQQLDLIRTQTGKGTSEGGPQPATQSYQNKDWESDVRRWTSTSNSILSEQRLGKGRQKVDLNQQLDLIRTKTGKGTSEGGPQPATQSYQNKDWERDVRRWTSTSNSILSEQRLGKGPRKVDLNQQLNLIRTKTGKGTSEGGPQPATRSYQNKDWERDVRRWTSTSNSILSEQRLGKGRQKVDLNQQLNLIRTKTGKGTSEGGPQPATRSYQNKDWERDVRRWTSTSNSILSEQRQGKGRQKVDLNQQLNLIRTKTGKGTSEGGPQPATQSYQNKDWERDVRRWTSTSNSILSEQRLGKGRQKVDLNQQLNLIRTKTGKGTSEGGPQPATQSYQNKDWERDVRRWTSTSNSILSEQRLGKGRQKVDLNQQLDLIRTKTGKGTSEGGPQPATRSYQNKDWERDVRRWTSTSNSILSEQRLGKGRQKVDLNQQLDLIRTKTGKGTSEGGPQPATRSYQNKDWERDVRRWTSTSNSILSEQRLGKGRQKVDLNQQLDLIRTKTGKGKLEGGPQPATQSYQNKDWERDVRRWTSTSNSILSEQRLGKGS